MNALVYLLSEDSHECSGIEENGSDGKAAESGLSCWSFPGELGYMLPGCSHRRFYWSGNQGYLVSEVSTALRTSQGQTSHLTLPQPTAAGPPDTSIWISALSLIILHMSTNTLTFCGTKLSSLDDCPSGVTPASSFLRLSWCLEAPL